MSSYSPLKSLYVLDYQISTDFLRNTHCQMVTEPEKPVRSLCTMKQERKREKGGGKAEIIGLGGRLRRPCLHFQPDSH